MIRPLGWLLVSLLAFGFGGWSLRDQNPGQRGSISSRLLGPVSSLASSIEWVRFDLARRSGELDLAYSRAENALRLDPTSSSGWMLLAHHLTFDRGAPGTGFDAEERLVWVRAGLEILERGKAFVRRPDELDFTQGTFLAAQASYEPADVVWPGGARAALEAAAGHFRAAGQEEFAASALELIETLD